MNDFIFYIVIGFFACVGIAAVVANWIAAENIDPNYKHKGLANLLYPLGFGLNEKGKKYNRISWLLLLLLCIAVGVVAYFG